MFVDVRSGFHYYVFSVNAIHTRFEDESYFKEVDDVTIRVSLGLLAMVFCLVS
jgi:hypothetical protein